MATHDAEYSDSVVANRGFSRAIRCQLRGFCGVGPNCGGWSNYPGLGTCSARTQP